MVRSARLATPTPGIGRDPAARMSATCRILTTDTEDSALVARVLDARQRASSTTLDAAAFLKWQRAQGRTPWGQAHVTHLALTDGPALLASAARFELSGWLDGRSGSRVRGLGSLLAHAMRAVPAFDASSTRRSPQLRPPCAGIVLLFSTRG